MERSDRNANDAAAARAVRGEPRPATLRGGRRGRAFARWLAVLVAAVGLYALLGYAALPRYAHEPLERRLSQAISRPVSIGRLEFDPFLWRLRVHDLAVDSARATDGDDRDRLASLDELEVDVSSRSLLRLAPVISGLRVVRPHVRLSRDAQGRYEVEDLIDKWQATPGEPTPPPRFSVANISVHEGRIEIDDAMHRSRHEISSIEVRVPFVSSLPVDEDVRVEPHLSASLDGTAMTVGANALPFRTPKDWSFDVEWRPVDLARFAAYLPQPPAVVLRSARVGAKLRVHIVQAADTPPSIEVVGKASIADLVTAEPGGAPLFSAASIELDAIQSRWPQNRHSIGRVTVDGAALTAQRRSGNPRFFEPIFAALERARARGPVPTQSQSQSQSQSQLQAADPPAWRIDEIRLRGGRAWIADENFAPRPLRIALNDVDATVRSLGSEPAQPASFEVSLTLGDGGRLRASGSAAWQTGAVDASASLSALALKPWWWMAAPHVALELLGGKADLEARIRRVPAHDAHAATVLVEDGALQLRDIALQQRWDERRLLELARLDVAGVRVDPSRRVAHVGSLRMEGGNVLARREADSRWNWQRVRAAQGERPGKTDRGPDADAQAPADRDWTLELAKLDVRGFDASFEDASPGRPAGMRLESVTIEASDLTTARGAERARVSMRAKANRRGTLQVRGTLAPQPFEATLHVAARDVPLVPLQPWIDDYVDASVSRGSVAFDGDVAIAAAPDSAPGVSVRGSASVGDFSLLARTGRRELLEWKAVDVKGIEFVSAPARLELEEIEITGLRSRLVIDREGRLNLGSLLVQRESAKDGQAGGNPVARIGSVRIDDGDIDFSDFFVRPNYSARLTGLSGHVTRIDPQRPGDLELRGKLDNTGRVEISGQVNPLAASLYLDLRGEASDIDLPRLSPYATKYVGYGIEKGKLSAKVHYALVDRRLEARNDIVLDQLTFGEKAEGPDAPQLPVLFAVALLKDRNGVIDVSLPIEGSLDDPQFSLGGIVTRLIGNLVAKAVAAPFSLIARIAGTGDAELSSFAFEPGSDAIDPRTQETLRALAAALADRPALRVDISGHADRLSDSEPLRVRSIERRIRARKLRSAVGGDEPSHSTEDVRLDAQEYAKYLQQVWREAGFPKNRGIGGPPDAESAGPDVEAMRADLIAASTASDSALLALANRRAQAVKDWLVEHGGIDPARLFLTAARIDAPDDPAGTDGPGQGADPVGAAPAGAAPAGPAPAHAGPAATAHAGPRVELTLR